MKSVFLEKLLDDVVSINVRWNYWRPVNCQWRIVWVVVRIILRFFRSTWRPAFVPPTLRLSSHMIITRQCNKTPQCERKAKVLYLGCCGACQRFGLKPNRNILKLTKEKQKFYLICLAEDPGLRSVVPKLSKQACIFGALWRKFSSNLDNDAIH